MAHLAADRLRADDRVFRNQPPSTRAQRRALKDKEAREKYLLEQRPPVHGQKYINYGRGIASAAEGTVAYISEQDRFYTDFAEEEKKRREHVLKTKEEQTQHRRMEKVKTEEARWKRIDADFAAERARQRRLMRSGAPSNESSVPYNPLTLQYAPSNAGEELKYQDEQIRYRAALRSEKLRKLEQREGFNPITGEMLRPVRMPDKPTRQF